MDTAKTKLRPAIKYILPNQKGALWLLIGILQAFLLFFRFAGTFSQLNPTIVVDAKNEQ